MFRHPSSVPSKQVGATLILTALFIFAATVTVLFSILDADDINNERSKQTASSLGKAKEALISRAVMDGNRPGSLPCPSSSDDGVAPFFVGSNCPTYIGRLPWKTLDINDLRDGNTERLWYVLSPAYRDRSEVQPINPDSAGTLSVDGRDDIVAIVFAPGPPVSLQSRPSDNVTDYLEGNNSDGDDDYTAVTSVALNDRLIYITRDELMQAVVKRVAGELKSELLAYENANGRFPDASPIGAPLGPDSYLTQSGLDSGTAPVHRTDMVTCNYGGTTSASCSAAFSLVGSVALQRTSGTYPQWDSRYGSCSITTTSGSNDTCTCTGLGGCYVALFSSFSCSAAGICDMSLFSGAAKYIYTPPSYGAFTTIGTTGNCSVLDPNVECSGDGVFGINGLNPPSWLTDNNWQDFFYYHKRIAADLQVGSVTNVEALLIGTGRVLANTESKPSSNQSRPSPNINDYLDSTQNTTPNTLVYDGISTQNSTTYNDQSFIVAP